MSIASGQLAKQIRDALERQDATKAVNLDSQMRLNYGLRVTDICNKVREAGFDMDEWDDLLWEGRTSVRLTQKKAQGVCKT